MLESGDTKIIYNRADLMNLILSGVMVVGHGNDIRILKESIEFLKNSSRFTDQYLTFWWLLSI